MGEVSSVDEGIAFNRASIAPSEGVGKLVFDCVGWFSGVVSSKYCDNPLGGVGLLLLGSLVGEEG